MIMIMLMTTKRRRRRMRMMTTSMTMMMMIIIIIIIVIFSSIIMTIRMVMMTTTVAVVVLVTTTTTYRYMRTHVRKYVHIDISRTFLCPHKQLFPECIYTLKARPDSALIKQHLQDPKICVVPGLYTEGAISLSTAAHGISHRRASVYHLH